MSRIDIIQDAKKCVVFIGLEKEVSNGAIKQKLLNVVGTGFLVKDEDGVKLVTAGHVFYQAKKISDTDGAKPFIGVYKGETNKIGNYGTVYIDKERFNVDEKNDLGVVSVDGIEDKNCFSLDKIKLDNNYQEGTGCVSLGFPLVNDFLASSMIASVKSNAERKDIDFILTDTHVNPSSSGSPFFDETTGKVLGVVAGTFHNNFVGPVATENKVRAGIQIPRNIGLVRPSYYLKGLLKNNSK